MKIGFDLDGVLCNVDVGLLRVIDNMKDEVKKSAEEWYYRERKPLLNPILFLSAEDKFYIITSRPKRLEYITRPWVNRYYPNAIFINTDHETLTKKDNDREAIKDWLKKMAEKKAELVSKLDVYFEDSSDTVYWLRKMCPDTKIIQYGGRW